MWAYHQMLDCLFDTQWAIGQQSQQTTKKESHSSRCWLTTCIQKPGLSPCAISRKSKVSTTCWGRILKLEHSSMIDKCYILSMYKDLSSVPSNESFPPPRKKKQKHVFYFYLIFFHRIDLDDIPSPPPPPPASPRSSLTSYPPNFIHFHYPSIHQFLDI